MLSLVVPSYQRRQYLDRFLDRLAKVSDAALIGEVVIVLDGSTDGSRELVEAMISTYPVPLRYVWQPNGGLASARNLGAAEAREEIVWFLDDDMLVNAGALDTHARWDRTRSTVLVGPATIRHDDPLRRNAKRWYDERWDRLRTTDRLTMAQDIGFANASLPAEVAKQFRFDEEFRSYGPEDVELAIRMLEAGITFGYSADADCEHDFAPSAQERIDKLRHEGENRIVLLRRHPGAESIIFASDPGRLERLLRRLDHTLAALPLWVSARVVVGISRLPLPVRAVARLRGIAEVLALYSGVAKASRR